MLVHTYNFIVFNTVITEDKKQKKVPIKEFVILFPVEGNEGAEVAVRHSKLYANKHLTEDTELKTLGDHQYESEYLGITDADDFQIVTIKKKEFAYIPKVLANS